MKAEEIKKVHCFFEQSGTFKNEFIKLGISAEDYDIQNNFGQTDHVIDLFKEIETEYTNLTTSRPHDLTTSRPHDLTIFDRIDAESDLVLAFFPCIYFCENNDLYFSGAHFNLKGKSELEKTEIIIERARNREYFYEKILKLYAIAAKDKLRLIIENPYSPFHYLVNNFPVKPKIIDKNRMVRGDYFVKPTQYFFINCEPTHGRSEQNDKQKKSIANSESGIMAGLCSEERSMISPDYARNFICDFILGKQQDCIQQKEFDFFS